MLNFLRKLEEQASVPEIALTCVTRAVVLLYQEEVQVVGTHPGIASICRDMLSNPGDTIEDFLKKPQAEWKEVDFKVRKLANKILGQIHQEKGWN